jgi:hypothetical protein
MPNYSPILEPDYLSYHLKLKEALNEADDRYYAHQVLADNLWNLSKNIF